MPDLDVALTRLAALAEEASNQGRWSSGLDVMAETVFDGSNLVARTVSFRNAAFIAAADPLTVAAMTRSLKLLAEMRPELEDGHVTPEGPDEDNSEPYCFECETPWPCDRRVLFDSLDALAALLTKDHAWCTRSGCEDTWGDRRHCLCGVGECPVLTEGDA